MSIIDLTKRTTNDWNEYIQCISAQDSKIFVNDKVLLDNECPASLLLTIGDSYLLKGIPTIIPSSGIKIPPNKTVVFETKQQIALPYNVFGLVSGVGINIFNSGFVSSGKIDSGYKGKLKIAYFNGNDKSIIFKKDDLVACCAFWNTDYSIKYQLQDYNSDVRPDLEHVNVASAVLSWFKKNWYSVLASAISIIALIIGLR